MQYFPGDILQQMHITSSDLVRFWNGLDSKTVSSTLLIIVVLMIRWVIVAWLQKNDTVAPHVINQWKHRIRYITLIFCTLAILIIWAPELRAFAVSIVAVAAALVIGLKEIITCFLGTIIRANVEGAEIGGRIAIGNVHGDVVATDILSTTILEVNDFGQRTGRTVVVPNSMYLTSPAITESAEERKYILLTVSIPLKRDDDWKKIEQTLLETGRSLSEPYMKEAKKHFGRFNRKFGFDAPGPEPRVMFEWNDPDKITVILRFAVPVAEQHKKRQQIFRAVLGAEQWV